MLWQIIDRHVNKSDSQLYILLAGMEADQNTWPSPKRTKTGIRSLCHWSLSWPSLLYLFPRLQSVCSCISAIKSWCFWLAIHWYLPIIGMADYRPFWLTIGCFANNRYRPYYYAASADCYLQKVQFYYILTIPVPVSDSSPSDHLLWVTTFSTTNGCLPTAGFTVIRNAGITINNFLSISKGKNVRFL